MGRKNRVHQRKLERLYLRDVINYRKNGKGLPLQGEWVFNRQSLRVKDFVRSIHLMRNRSPKNAMFMFIKKSP